MGDELKPQDLHATAEPLETKDPRATEEGAVRKQDLHATEEPLEVKDLHATSEPFKPTK
ncbi:hypothetical protein ABTX62_32950 [Streptomyces sp. NPDC096046]|uniref:hypothetical protein n=1 Tax=Streptomyces sp. NPDC096046 TaxID=3155542 RepID=UPI00332ED390